MAVSLRQSPHKNRPNSQVSGSGFTSLGEAPSTAGNGKGGPPDLGPDSAGGPAPTLDTSLGGRIALANATQNSINPVSVFGQLAGMFAGPLGPVFSLGLKAALAHNNAQLNTAARNAPVGFRGLNVDDNAPDSANDTGSVGQMGLSAAPGIASGIADAAAGNPGIATPDVGVGVTGPPDVGEGPGPGNPGSGGSGAPTGDAPGPTGDAPGDAGGGVSGVFHQGGYVPQDMNASLQGGEYVVPRGGLAEGLRQASPFDQYSELLQKSPIKDYIDPRQAAMGQLQNVMGNMFAGGAQLQPGPNQQQQPQPQPEQNQQDNGPGGSGGTFDGSMYKLKKLMLEFAQPREGGSSGSRQRPSEP